MYEFGSYNISESGEEFLEQFVPKYFGIILQDRFKDEISNIIIEGHTDNEGTYLYNLSLSQNRAFSVVETIYAEEFPNFKEKDLSKEFITSNGRSFTVPLTNEQGEYDPEKSRRVEFLFRLKEDERIQEIQKLVSEDEI